MRQRSRDDILGAGCIEVFAKQKLEVGHIGEAWGLENPTKQACELVMQADRARPLESGQLAPSRPRRDHSLAAGATDAHIGKQGPGYDTMAC